MALAFLSTVSQLSSIAPPPAAPRRQSQELARPCQSIPRHSIRQTNNVDVLVEQWNRGQSDLDIYSPTDDLTPVQLGNPAAPAPPPRPWTPAGGAHNAPPQPGPARGHARLHSPHRPASPPARSASLRGRADVSAASAEAALQFTDYSSYGLSSPVLPGAWGHGLTVPHLDGGGGADPAEVLDQVRSQMLARPRCSSLITCAETGAALCDLLSVLILLDQDLRAAEPGSVVLFQPVLDMRAKLAAAGAQAAPGLLSPEEHQDLAPHHQPGAALRRQSAPGAMLPARPWGGAAPAGQYTSPCLAVAVIHARCPKMVIAQPACCFVAMLDMECAEMAAAIAGTVMAQGSTRLRCVSSARGLVVAFRALRAVRLLVRRQGPWDVLILPQLSSHEQHSSPGAAAPGLRQGSSSGAGGQAGDLRDRPLRSSAVPRGQGGAGKQALLQNNIVVGPGQTVLQGEGWPTAQAIEGEEGDTTQQPRPVAATMDGTQGSGRTGADAGGAVMFFNIWRRSRDA